MSTTKTATDHDCIDINNAPTGLPCEACKAESCPPEQPAATEQWCADCDQIASEFCIEFHTTRLREQQLAAVEATARPLKVKVSPPFVAKGALDSFKQKSSFTLVTLDVEGDGPKHHAAIMVWGDGADVAANRARTIMQAVNNFDALADALREARAEISRLNKAAGETVFNPAATELLDAALALAGGAANGDGR